MMVTHVANQSMNRCLAYDVWYRKYGGLLKCIQMKYDHSPNITGLIQWNHCNHYRLYQKKLYNLVWTITNKVKIAWPQEFTQYSTILLAVWCFLNDVIPLLESKDMLNLVIEGKNKLGNFRAILTT